MTFLAKRGLRGPADRIVDYLARSEGLGSRILNLVMRTVAPSLAAVVEFRRGHLSRALALASPSSRVELRSREMLNTLEAPWPPRERDSEAKSKRSFNGRVLFLVHSAPSYDIHGYAVRSRQIVRSLRSCGIEYTLAARFGYPWDLPGRAGLDTLQISRFEDLAFEHRRDPELLISVSDRRYLNEYQKYVVGLIRRDDCSVVHANSNYLNGIAGAAAGSETGCLSIYEMRGLWHVTRGSRDPVYLNSEHFAYCERMELLAADRSDHVVAISSPLKEWLVARGIPEAKISVIGNAAETRAVGQRVRRSSRPNDSVRVGYVGSLVDYEGLDVLLHAARILLDTGRALEVQIVGDGPARKHLLRLSRTLGLQECVRFLGKLPPDRAADLYTWFDVCPLPRQRLPVTELVPPLKPLEIMAHGVPIVVSDLRPLAELVADGESGLLCEPGSAQSLADAIAHLLDYPDKADRMADKARAFVARTHTWERNAEAYLSLYRWKDVQELEARRGEPS